MAFRIRRMRPIRAITVVGLIAAGLVAGPLAGVAHAAATFVVNTAGNASDTFIDGNCDTSGSPGLQCTLRGAIQEANGAAGLDTIDFNLPSPYKVTLTSTGLPAITSPVLIDGTSEPSYNPAGGVIVRVDGVANSTGVQYDFDVQPGGGGTTIKGLEIDRAGSAGIRLQTDNNVVSGNYIGSTAANTVNCATGVSCSDNVGVLIADGSNNVVGGTTAADRNVISNNGSYGVQVSATVSAGGNTIKGNYIGTNVAGSAALANGYGVVIFNQGADPTATTIGGTAAGAGNVISGNSNNGVDISAGSATVAGNTVGLAASGTTAVANGGAGISLSGSSTAVTVGGATSASRNVVSGNNSSGVSISGPTQQITVENNYLGPDSTGTAAVGDGFAGLYANSADNLLVDSNLISGNTMFNEDLRLDNGAGATVSNNIIGLAADGATVLAGPSDGIDLNSTIDTTISGNTISGHSSAGINASSVDGLVVTDNKIGTDSTGTLDRGNSQGVNLTGSEIAIGSPGHGNVISGNDSYGIVTSADHGTIQGNIIGADASGTSALGNGASGIWLNTAEDTMIGGAATGAGNVIVANGVGVGDLGIYFSNADDNTVLGNRIGVGSTGGALPNSWAGIYLDGSSNNNQIGSTATGGGNIIADNADAGLVAVPNALGNTIRGNSIHDNGALGIDLNQDGVTANDTGDPDFGANRLQNFPVLSTSASNANGTQVSGTLNSKANHQYALDFYANSACDSSGNGEGDGYLGSATVTTNGSGNATFQASLPVSAAAGSQITATATDVNLGDTSEFSACLANQGGLPSVSVANASASEGAGNVSFTVSLSSAPVFAPVTVQYATADGTATSPADYTASSGTVTFNVGETSKQVNVPIINDSLDENDETFTLTLSNPTNAFIAPGQDTATGTIQDNDAPPTVSIAHPANVTEPDAGSVNQTFTISLSAPTSLPVTVIADTVSGSATEGVDYTPNAAQLTFNPGQTSKTFTVAVLGDTIDEFNESYTVQLLSPTNATIGTGSTTGTINDNDAPPTVSISDATGPEGNSGTSGFTFVITLSTASAKIVRVSIPGETDGTATAGSDYIAKGAQLLNIPAGNTTKNYIVKVKGDHAVEPNETFFVTIDPGTTVNATVADGSGTGTIVNDD